MRLDSAPCLNEGDIRAELREVHAVMRDLDAAQRNVRTYTCELVRIHHHLLFIVSSITGTDLSELSPVSLDAVELAKLAATLSGEHKKDLTGCLLMLHDAVHTARMVYLVTQVKTIVMEIDALGREAGRRDEDGEPGSHVDRLVRTGHRLGEEEKEGRRLNDQILERDKSREAVKGGATAPAPSPPSLADLLTVLHREQFG